MHPGQLVWSVIIESLELYILPDISMAGHGFMPSSISEWFQVPSQVVVGFVSFNCNNDCLAVENNRHSSVVRPLK